MKKKKGSPLFKIVATLSIGLLVFVFATKIAGLSKYQKEIDSLNAQITEQKEYSKELDKISKEYASDEYVEKYARSIGLVKPNEKIFRNYNDKK